MLIGLGIIVAMVLAQSVRIYFTDHLSEEDRLRALRLNAITREATPLLERRRGPCTAAERVAINARLTQLQAAIHAEGIR